MASIIHVKSKIVIHCVSLLRIMQINARMDELMVAISLDATVSKHPMKSPFTLCQAWKHSDCNKNIRIVNTWSV